MTTQFIRIKDMFSKLGRNKVKINLHYTIYLVVILLNALEFIKCFLFYKFFSIKAVYFYMDHIQLAYLLYLPY